MEIRISTRQILKILHVFSWIIFLGACIEAGGIIFNAFYKMVLNPDSIGNFWREADLSDLYKHDPGHFLAVTILMSIVAIMRALIFYLIVKILHDKKLNMSQPFTEEVGRFIINVSWLALGIGLFSNWGVNYTEWMANQGVKMPDIQYLGLGGADVWLFMGVTLLVIAQLFKRGIEIQNENDLTI